MEEQRREPSPLPSKPTDQLLTPEQISAMFAERGITSRTTNEMIEELLKRCQDNPKMRENILNPSESERWR